MIAQLYGGPLDGSVGRVSSDAAAVTLPLFAVRDDGAVEAHPFQETYRYCPHATKHFGKPTFLHSSIDAFAFAD